MWLSSSFRIQTNLILKEKLDLEEGSQKKIHSQVLRAVEFLIL